MLRRIGFTEKSRRHRLFECPIEGNCVYKTTDNVCDDIQTNKGNSDAKCYRKSNSWIIKKKEG